MPRIDTAFQFAAGRRAFAALALALTACTGPYAVAQSPMGAPPDRYGAAVPTVTPPAADGGQVLLAYDRDASAAAAGHSNPLRAAQEAVAQRELAVQEQLAALPSGASVEPAGYEIELPDVSPEGSSNEDDESAALDSATLNAAALEATLAAAMEPPAAADQAASPNAGVPGADAMLRRLAPRSADAPSRGSSDSASRAPSMFPAAFSKLESLTTAGTGLAVVVGLFVLCMWLLRRGGGKSVGGLPGEAFAVLGRAPLSPQSFAQLLRVGNKLVLVAITPQGAQTLAEVTDPMEVGRLIGLCANGQSHGPSAEFQQVLAQLAREPARGFLDNDTNKAGAGRRS